MKTESEKVGERESESVSIVLHVNVSLDMNKVTKREVDLVQDLCERLSRLNAPDFHITDTHLSPQILNPKS
jgi:hypothetical protein